MNCTLTTLLPISTRKEQAYIKLLPRPLVFLKR
jgi:hypothetical protein